LGFVVVGQRVERGTSSPWENRMSCVMKTRPEKNISMEWTSRQMNGEEGREVSGGEKEKNRFKDLIKKIKSPNEPSVRKGGGVIRGDAKINPRENSRPCNWRNSLEFW